MLVTLILFIINSSFSSYPLYFPQFTPQHFPTMGNKQVKQHFETAQKTGVLKISLMRLQEFPTPLKQFPNVLKSLDLSENRFPNIPDDIAKFTLLKTLNVGSNKIEALPDTLGLLVKLENLLAGNNMILYVTPSLCNLRNLKQVLLGNNQITQFPMMLCGLVKLDMLDLSRNKITAIPDGVQSLMTVELNLNQNQVAAISSDIADCQNLKTLRLEENCLQAAAIPVRLLKESVVCNLALDGNLFSSKQLSELEGYETYMERYTAVKKKMF